MKHTSTIDLSPKRETLDATHFDQLISLWLDHIADKCSERTHYSYNNTINYFRHWWSDYGPAHDYALSKSAFRNFNNHLDTLIGFKSQEVLAWATRDNALRRVRQIFKWAAEEGYIDRNYSTWVPSANGRPDEKEPLPRDILQKLFEASNKTENPKRARCAISILGGTGMRRGEAAALNVEDIILDGKSIDHILVRARLKNGKTRAVAIAESGMPHVLDFIDQRQHGPLFIHAGARANARMILRDCTETAFHAGVKLDRPCHDLRVAFATHWARNRRGQIHGNILSKQLGHSNFETTRKHYIQTDIQDIQEVMINPFEKIGDRADG